MRSLTVLRIVFLHMHSPLSDGGELGHERLVFLRRNCFDALDSETLNKFLDLCVVASILLDLADDDLRDVVERQGRS